MTVSTAGRRPTKSNRGRFGACVETTRPQDSENVSPPSAPTMRQEAKPNSLWTPEAKEQLARHHTGIEWFAQLDRAHQRPWTMFATMTFRPEASLPRHRALEAGRRFTLWLSAWRGALARGGRVIRLALWSAEEHKSGNVHLHALWAHFPGQSVKHCNRCLSLLTPTEPDWRVFKDSWFIHWGIGRFYPYNEKLRFGAERYVTKYVLAENCLDWGVWEG